MRKGSVALVLLMLLFLLPTQAQASGEIRGNLVQPAVQDANAGDVITYDLQILFPEGYQYIYRSMGASVKFDPRVEPISQEIIGVSIPEGYYRITDSRAATNNVSFVTFSVSDLTKLQGTQTLNLRMQVKVRDGYSKVNDLKNTMVLTYMDMNGNEFGNQQDVVTDGTQINPIQAYTNTITGKTNPNTRIDIYRGSTLVAQGVSDESGNFQIVINPQPEGAELRFEIYASSGKVTRTMVVGEEEAPGGQPSDDVVKLQDYVRVVEKMSNTNLTQEQIFQKNAAVSMGQYLLIKSNVTSEEIGNGIRSLETAYEQVRLPFMNGYPDGTFAPTKSMTRAEVASVFTKIMTKGSMGNSFSSFRDVSDSKWYAGSIGYMEKTGVISGYLDGTFRPENSISRAEFAALISKYMKLNTGAGAKNFKDVKSSFWAKQYIDQVSAAGLMNGREDGSFGPNDKITRQEVATVLNKVLQRVPDENFIGKYGSNPFKDVNRNSWAYFQIMEATAN